jgi:hypothetical protein
MVTAGVNQAATKETNMTEAAINTMTHTAMESGEGILRMAPNWVPRSLCVPGRRLKLAAEDLYAYGAHRGGIDERWFASTTMAMNEERTPDEGLSYVVLGDHRFTLKDAIDADGPRLIGPKMWDEFHRWPVYSKFFDNLGPIPLHLHPNTAQAKLVGQEGKPEAYYFPSQLNPIDNNFPHTYFGLEPGTTREQVRRCLERWDHGDNEILDLSRAYRLRPGTGWLVPPCVLHAPGSLLTYEPQWGSDVGAVYQSMAEGRAVPRNELVKDVPKDKQKDLDFLVDLIDWPANTDTHFRQHHFLQPIPVADTASEGYVDTWVVYGKVDGRQLFSAKGLTLQPGVKCTIKDTGAYGLIVTEGHGRIGKLALDCPAMIRFGQLTEDEVFVSHEAASAGVTFENHSSRESLVVLRAFGPDANPAAPEIGS